MGVLPVQFQSGEGRKSHQLKGDEEYTIALSDDLAPGKEVVVTVHRANGETDEMTCLCRLDTAQEVQYYRDGGVLRHVLTKMMA